MKHKTKVWIHLIVLGVLGFLVYATWFLMNRDTIAFFLIVLIILISPKVGSAFKNYRDKQRKPMKTIGQGPGR